MSLADYLAKKYLTADAQPEKKKSKKRKRKEAEAGGLIIADDDATGWNSGPQTNDDDEAPMSVAGNSAEFRKKKTSAWKTVGSSAPSNADQAAADAIIASAAAENRAAGAETDEAPTIADGNNDDDGPAMESGAAAGLQTAAQVTAALEKRQREERKHMEAAMREAGASAGETIYRDASGRIINVAMKRAEARRAASEAEAKKRQEEEEAKGDVQRAEKEARRQALADAKYMPLARGVDDKEMNEEMKEVERWNDPAMQFLTSKKEKKSKSGKPLYKGAFEPNRYGIRPGHRWDGVDRSNGFEREWFKSRNARSNRRDLEYAWQMDE
ncbi:Pre-mRNA-splicing factor of RES complex-domain-containing protein [Phyllosticta capitalensis]|uniref:Pre-mRNA-splicing factor cwc26 n=1 Tax=Phyllosticta capitalensis TaxID=121624 RepID=A0ABR1Z525_9PEZI